MLFTPFVVIWLVGFIADLDVDSWLIKGLMYAAVWIIVQFLSKYDTHTFIDCWCTVCTTYFITEILSLTFIIMLQLFLFYNISPSVCLSFCLCRSFFDHSMHSTLPLGIYLATKFWMYITWFYWFWNDILHML